MTLSHQNEPKDSVTCQNGPNGQQVGLGGFVILLDQKGLSGSLTLSTTQKGPDASVTLSTQKGPDVSVFCSPYCVVVIFLV